MAAAKRKFVLRIDPEVMTLLEEDAEREHRSANGHIEHILSLYVDSVCERRAILRQDAAGLPVREAVVRAHERARERDGADNG